MAGEGATSPAAGTDSRAATIRVVVVDDHEIVREGVSTLLGLAEDMVVCGEAGSASEAVSVADATKPDVMLMDVRLGGGSGIEATREIRARWPDTKVIILTSFADEDALFASIMAGASGYVLKQIRRNDLVAAVRQVASGQSLLDPAVTSPLFERLRATSRTPTDSKLASLSPREAQILALITEGRTNREIAAELMIAEKTVKNAISQVLNKLQVARRSEAAAYLTRYKRPAGG